MCCIYALYLTLISFTPADNNLFNAHFLLSIENFFNSRFLSILYSIHRGAVLMPFAHFLVCSKESIADLSPKINPLFCCIRRIAQTDSAEAYERRTLC